MTQHSSPRSALVQNKSRLPVFLPCSWHMGLALLLVQWIELTTTTTATTTYAATFFFHPWQCTVSGVPSCYQLITDNRSPTQQEKSTREISHIKNSKANTGRTGGGSVPSQNEHLSHREHRNMILLAVICRQKGQKHRPISHLMSTSMEWIAASKQQLKQIFEIRLCTWQRLRYLT